MPSKKSPSVSQPAKSVLLVLGNQLFESSELPIKPSDNAIVYMREDFELCTYFKYHKHKIMFFLSAMRKYAEELRSQGFTVHYEALGDSKKTFEQAFMSFIKNEKIERVCFFEIEDKFFESRLIDQIKKSGCQAEQRRSPMFLTSRQQFKDYLGGTKRPFMKTFYEGQRKRLNILIDKNGKPSGGQWSFDEDNRKPLPKNYKPSPIQDYTMDKTDKLVGTLVEKHFASHPGQADDFWLPTDRKRAREWLKLFLKERFENFGIYEDALSPEHPFINHSVLTPYLNVGLITPQEVVEEALKAAQKYKIPMNSCEGFIRQVIGWREFIRGIYQNFSEQQDESNFFKHKRRLTDDWYKGTTGIAPLDDVIKKTIRYGYAHHIERLMVVGSLMLLLEVHPQAAHAWFMEMFIDSSDWVMGPNVYGMALFSDGGIFATKPYFCGSNYYKKMGPYKSGDWQEGVDGLYWSFIENHKDFFLKNHRMSMMVRTVEKMPADKKKNIYKKAQELKNRITTLEKK